MYVPVKSVFQFIFIIKQKWNWTDGAMRVNAFAGRKLSYGGKGWLLAAEVSDYLAEFMPFSVHQHVNTE